LPGDANRRGSGEPDLEIFGDFEDAQAALGTGEDNGATVLIADVAAPFVRILNQQPPPRVLGISSR
jgi:hypothetical protein